MSRLTEEKFIELVRAAESEARKNPRAYKTRLALFAALGYVVIVLVVVLLLLIVAGSVFAAVYSHHLALLLIKPKIFVVVLVAIWTLLKALWVKFEKPQGYELKRNEFPELFREIDSVSKALCSLKIHKVILEKRMNASVMQYPRFGVLGGQLNYLYLGLDMLLVLSPEQMRAVLAHEFGHLSGNHSRFAAWIYRVRISWNRIADAFHSSHSWGGKIMRKFFDWYAPQFDAYSFALARQNEYEADAISAQLTSPDIAAQSLVKVYVIGKHLDENFWNSYFGKADKLPVPSCGPYRALVSYLEQLPVAEHVWQSGLQECLAVQTHYSDTHPALKDRLDYLQATNTMPEHMIVSAAQKWLGNRYAGLLEDFDAQWLENNAESWKKRYEHVTGSKEKISEFSKKEITELSDDDLWDYANCAREFGGHDTALALYQAFHKRNPDSIGASYCVGCLLMEKNDGEALPYLRRAFEKPQLLREAAQRGYYLLDTVLGKKADAEQWWQVAMTVNEEHRAADHECNSLTMRDDLKAPEIEESLREALKNVMLSHKGVGKTWLAQKVTRYSAKPVYVLAFQARGFHRSYEALQKAVAARLTMDAHIFVVCLNGDAAKLGKRVKKAGVHP